MGRLFGTDGGRGVAGSDLTAGLAMSLPPRRPAVLVGSGAFASPDRLAARPPGASGARPLAVVGRDPRASGEFLEAAVVAGLAASGVDVLRLGVIPTPAVAYLTAALDADFGVMLSASHNPAPDNGIKIFARGGVKLPDAVEDQIEARLAGAAQRGRDPDPEHGLGTAGTARTASPRAGSAGSGMPPARASATWTTCCPPLTGPEHAETEAHLEPPSRPAHRRGLRARLRLRLRARPAAPAPGPRSSRSAPTRTA